MESCLKQSLDTLDTSQHLLSQTWCVQVDYTLSHLDSFRPLNKNDVQELFSASHDGSIRVADVRYGRSREVCSPEAPGCQEIRMFREALIMIRPSANQGRRLR